MPQDLGLLSHCSFLHFAFSETRSSCPSRKDQAAKIQWFVKRDNLDKANKLSQTDLLGSRLPECVVGLWERNATWAPTLKQHLGIHCAWKNINNMFSKTFAKVKRQHLGQEKWRWQWEGFLPSRRRACGSRAWSWSRRSGGRRRPGRATLNTFAFCSGWGTALFNFCAYLRP